MTKEQLKKYILAKNEEYRKMWEANLDPQNQHLWDDMLRLEGFIGGLQFAFALHYPEEDLQ